MTRLKNYNHEQVMASQRLDGLLETTDGRRKTVCAGSSKMLLNILSCVGIECKCISGRIKEYPIDHAWNQVKIGGVWLNLDFTNDQARIVKQEGKPDVSFLKTDKEFNDYLQYSEERSNYEEKCGMPASYLQYLQQHGINFDGEINMDVVNQILYTFLSL